MPNKQWVKQPHILWLRIKVDLVKGPHGGAKSTVSHKAGFFHPNGSKKGLYLAVGY